MTDLLTHIRAAQESLHQAERYATYADRDHDELAQYMVWQAKQFLRPIRRPSIRGKAATERTRA